MLINKKSVKSKIAESGLRCKPEVIIAIDRHLDNKINLWVTQAKTKQSRTLTIMDVM